MNFKVLLVVSTLLSSLFAVTISPYIGTIWNYSITENENGGFAIYSETNKYEREITAESLQVYSCKDDGKTITQVGWSLPDTTDLNFSYTFSSVTVDTQECIVSIPKTSQHSAEHYKLFQYIDETDTAVTLYKDLSIGASKRSFYVKEEVNGDSSKSYIWEEGVGLLSYEKSSIVGSGFDKTESTTKIVLTTFNNEAVDITTIKEYINNAKNGTNVLDIPKSVNNEITVINTQGTLKLLSTSNIEIVKLMSPMGKVLYFEAGQNITTIPLQSLATGFFIMQVKSVDGMHVLPVNLR